MVVVKKKYKCTTDVYNDYSKEKLITQQIGIMNYSNVGYIILGALIEKITNEKYIDFVKNNILIPLKMENTGDEDTNITLYDFNKI
jgi:CubicO group peptidase (beta-lactamase class C family)